MIISIIPASAMADSGNGWVKENNKWYYYKDGQRVKNQWIKDGGKWYYLFYDGEMASDSVAPEGPEDFSRLYYVDKSGAMVTKTGWRKYPAGSSDPYWIYITKGGVLADGWKKIGGKWYCFIIFMLTNKMMPDGVVYSGKLYFFNEDGSMKSNCWVKNTDGYWFCLGKDGGSITGWKKTGGKWYYLDPEEHGRSVMNTTMKIGTKWYSFDETGACINPDGSSEVPDKSKPIVLPFVPADELN